MSHLGLVGGRERQKTPHRVPPLRLRRPALTLPAKQPCAQAKEISLEQAARAAAHLALERAPLPGAAWGSAGQGGHVAARETCRVAVESSGNEAIKEASMRGPRGRGSSTRAVERELAAGTFHALQS